MFPEQSLSRPRLQTIIDRDWINQWRETIVPDQGQQKILGGAGMAESPGPGFEPGNLVITMEPGLAFGTGFHPTTQLCLEFLETLVPENARAVLDYGTGTGLLAMAAASSARKRWRPRISIRSRCVWRRRILHAINCQEKSRSSWAEKTPHRRLYPVEI